MIFWCLNVGNSIDLGKSYYKDNLIIRLCTCYIRNY